MGLSLHGHVYRAVGGLGIGVGLGLGVSIVGAVGAPWVKAFEAGLQGIRVVPTEIHLEDGFVPLQTDTIDLEVSAGAAGSQAFASIDAKGGVARADAEFVQLISRIDVSSNRGIIEDFTSHRPPQPSPRSRIKKQRPCVVVVGEQITMSLQDDEGIQVRFADVLRQTEPVVRSVKSENVCSILNIGSCSRLIRACRLSGMVVVAALVAPLADRIGGMRDGGGIACVQPELEPGKLRGGIEGDGRAVEDGQFGVFAACFKDVEVDHRRSAAKIAGVDVSHDGYVGDNGQGERLGLAGPG